MTIVKVTVCSKLTGVYQNLSKFLQDVFVNKDYSTVYMKKQRNMSNNYFENKYTGWGQFQ